MAQRNDERFWWRIFARTGSVEAYLAANETVRHETDQDDGDRYKNGGFSRLCPHDHAFEPAGRAARHLFKGLPETEREIAGGGADVLLCGF